MTLPRLGRGSRLRRDDPTRVLRAAAARPPWLPRRNRGSAGQGLTEQQQCGKSIQYFQIYVAGVSLITMFFLTGHGETLYNEDVSREMVYLVLQLIQEII